MQKYNLKYLYFILGVVLLLFVACSDQKTPIRLGFVAGLSGENVDLGQAGRNGALLAVQEANQAGGINNRLIELIIRDDQNSRQGAATAAQDLVKQKVSAIVGPFTSTMAEAVRTVTEPQKMVVFSPTTSSSRLAGLDDYFFRLCSTTSDQAANYARFMAENRKLTRIAMVVLKRNLTFVKSWVHAFKKQLQTYNAEIVTEIWYDSNNDVKIGNLIQRVVAAKPDGVLFVANAVVVARMAQQLRKQNNTIKMFVVEWAGTQQLIELGGRAVDGLEVLHLFNKYGREKNFVSFVRNYKRQFHEEPSFSSIIAYEVVNVLLSAIKKQRKGESLKNTILANNPYQGLQQTFIIDVYGDTIRDTYFVIVKGRQFIPAPR